MLGRQQRGSQQHVISPEIEPLRGHQKRTPKVQPPRWSRRRVARVPSLNPGIIASWACAVRIARRSRLSLALMTPLTAPPTSPHRGEKGVGWPVVLSYEFERPHREQIERRSRSRSSDRASPVTRPALDMRSGPVKHWGEVFQVGPSRGVGGQIEAPVQTDCRSVRSVPARTR